MSIRFRQATIDDLPDVIRMLADDFLGQQRESLEASPKESYVQAFHEIEADPNNELIVAVLSSTTPSAEATATAPIQEGSQKIIGTLQLTFTPSLSYQGGRRCTVESVRVDGKFRGKGIGREMMMWAIKRAKEKGCVSMQLMSHSDRVDAHRFYEKLGFKRSHVGMKLVLK